MTDWREAGCARDCTEQHTYTPGRCALAVVPDTPPRPLIASVEPMPDGMPGIVVRARPTASTITDTQLDQLYAENDRLAAELADYDQRVQRLDAELAALRQVARGYCHACGRGDAAPSVDDWEQQKQRADEAEGQLRLADAMRQQNLDAAAAAIQRAEQAEAALARVRDACDRLRRAAVLADGQPHTDRERGIIHAVNRVLTALNTPPAETTGQAGEEQPGPA